MHTPRMSLLSSAVILMLCLSVGQTTAQEGDPDLLPTALGTAFTYQGQLKDIGGKPIPSNCDFQFGLWDALSGGAQVAGTVTQTVPALVTDGLFNALVDFGAPAFDGNNRWLAVAVKCSGDPVFTPLSPRQALTPVPYALTAARLPWGASWSGSGTGTGLSLSGGAIGLSGNGSLYGVQGQAAGSGTGVYGTAPITGVTGLATATGGIGVYGRSNTTSSYGVYGYAPIGTAGVYGESSTNYGVYGRGDTGVYGYSTSGYGVHGRGDTGVYGYSSSTTGYGVHGFATAGSGTNYGVRGESASTSGYGVYGSATASSGTTYGVRGVSSSTSGYGIYGTAPTTGTVGIANDSDGFNGVGVYGQSDTWNGTGVYGYATADTAWTAGVRGESDSTSGYGVYAAGHTGVFGLSNVGTYRKGGHFIASGVNSVGVLAASDLGNIIEGTGFNDQRMFYVTNFGDVHAAGEFTPGGADFAEMLPAEEALQPGDLLAIGPDGKLVKTTSAYQPSVAGVYSTQPGFVGGAADGQDTTGKIPLAVVGVVPVKVSAENGAIQPGVLLTASDTPAHAMKASPITVSGVTFYPSGVVIGKALEGLDDGTGLISVLVTLQ